MRPTRLPPLAALALAALAPLAADAAALQAGARAPDFTLRSADGRNVRLEELRGQVVLVNFWASWCGPCREEMPRLNAMHAKYRKSGVTLLGVNVDDKPETALAAMKKLGVDFPVLLDADKAVSTRYELSAMPSTVIVDRDGKVRYVHRGYRAGDEADYEQALRGLLKE